MTAGKQVNRTRTVTGSMSVTKRGFVNEWSENSRVRQAVLQGGAVCRPAAQTSEARIRSGAAPIWLAALLASRCHAVANGRSHVIRWDWALGHALYTNRSSASESIRPLGVQLQGGETLAVSWRPGESAYSMEIFKHNSLPQLGRAKTLMH
jgi:hypothetical protein